MQLALDLLTGRIYLFFEIIFSQAIQHLEHALGKKNTLLIDKFEFPVPKLSQTPTHRISAVFELI